jgi:alcohol dehydrogenase class IV
MFQQIEFRTPSIIFGMDTITQIGQQARKLGAGRVLVVTGPGCRRQGSSKGQYLF